MMQTVQTVLRSAVSAIESHNPSRRGHAERVSSFAVAAAHQIGFRGDELIAMRCAAALHEIGKFAVSPDILESPFPLTEEELALIRNSSQQGADAVRKLLDSRFHAAADWIEHQYNWAEAGPPTGSRILLVCIAFDVMTTRQPWRQPLDENAAIEQLRAGSGTQFDADVLEAFLFVQPLIQPVLLNEQP
jgi:HD-GYP domain-containing protein (c-di-GMP phosphodiesterase class II)